MQTWQMLCYTDNLDIYICGWTGGLISFRHFKVYRIEPGIWSGCNDILQRHTRGEKKSLYDFHMYIPMVISKHVTEYSIIAKDSVLYTTRCRWDCQLWQCQQWILIFTSQSSCSTCHSYVEFGVFLCDRLCMTLVASDYIHKWATCWYWWLDDSSLVWTNN